MKAPNTVALCMLCLYVGSFSYSATYYVDDDAPNDPGPDDSVVSDPLEDGSIGHPYDAIQEAVDIIDVNDVILVQTGTYCENLVFPGIDFVLTSSNPQDDTVVSNTIIDGNDLGRVITFAGTESPQCLLIGLTIYNGFYVISSSMDDIGGGIFGNHTTATISNCVISENYAQDAGGGVAECDGLIENCLIDNNGSGGAGAIYNCAGVIKNCTITNNHSYNPGGVIQGSAGGAITSSNASIESCIISHNVSRRDSTIVYCHGPIFNCIISGNSILTYDGYLTSSGAGISNCNGNIRNCTITGNRAANRPGIVLCSGVVENCIIVANIANDPDVSQVANCPKISFSCFKDGSGNGNFDADPLFVQNGHWDDNFTPWDSGDDIWTEGDYHLKSTGWRWDQSHYPTSDFTGNGLVNMEDFVTLANNWQQSGTGIEGDLNLDNFVGIEDLLFICEAFLTDGKQHCGEWVWDDTTSPCIDAGNPGIALGDEQMPEEIDPGNLRGQNVRINMGAYGGTGEAGLAPPGWALLCDLDNSGDVNMDDFILMADAWLQATETQTPDVSRDGTVNLEDIGLLGEDWLKTTTWY